MVDRSTVSVPRGISTLWRRWRQRFDDTMRIEKREERPASPPPDPKVLLRQAGDEREAGNIDRAIALYLRAARMLEQIADWDRALVAYALAEKIAPDRLETLLMIAEAYERRALRKDAIEHYQRAAEISDHRGDIEQATAIRTRLVGLDPQNVNARLRIAEHLFDRDRAPEAITALREALSILQDKRRFDEYWVVARQVLRHAPEDAVLTRLFARVHLKRGELVPALDLLERHFEARVAQDKTDEQVKRSASLLIGAGRAYLSHGREGHAAQCCRRLLGAGFAAFEPKAIVAPFSEQTEREPAEPVMTPDWKELSMAELLDTNEPTRRAPFVRLIAETVNEISTEQLAPARISKPPPPPVPVPEEVIALFEPDLSIHERNTRQVAPLVVDLVIGSSY